MDRKISKNRFIKASLYGVWLLICRAGSEKASAERLLYRINERKPQKSRKNVKKTTVQALDTGIEKCYNSSTSARGFFFCA
jgi:hypothetical protein